MDLSVNKGGVCWAEYTLTRGPKGLDVWIRVVPKIEEFIQSLGSGKVDPVEAYGKEWFQIGQEPLLIRRIDKKIVDESSWTLEKVGESVARFDPRELAAAGEPKPKVNLSFLRIVGVSSDAGVRFGVSGAYSKDFIKQFGDDLSKETSRLVRQYVVPVSINFRIHSQE